MNKFKLKNLLIPQTKYFIVAQVAVVLETLIELQLPLFVAIMIDKGVLQSDFSVIKEYGTYYILFLILNALLVLLFVNATAYVSNGIASDFRMQSYKHINNLKLNELNTITPGALITRMTSDIKVLQDSISLCMRLSIRAPLLFVGGIVVLLFMDARFASILLVALIVLTIVVWFVIKKSQPIYKEVQERQDTLNTINQESIVGARTIKAFSGEQIEQKRFSESNYLAAHATFRVQRLMGILQPFFTIVMNIALAVLLVLASFAIQDSSLQIGDVMAAISYLTQILFALMMIVMIFPSLSRAITSYNRIKQIFDLEIENDDNTNQVEYRPLEKICSIDFCNVSFNYTQLENKKSQEDTQDSPNALNDISFSLCEGEKIAFLGTTGAGKSTLIKIIFGLYEATAGSVLINKYPIQDYSLIDRRKEISYVLQKPDLFNASIKENINFGDEEYSEEHIKKAAQIAHADRFISKFDEQYQKKLGSKGVGVSGGQKQRINLSRAFLKKSSLLILDDCTSALDLRTEKNVHQAIINTGMHNTLILISQKIESVRNMDKIYLMDNGCIVASGTHRELVLNSELYRSFCLSQSYNIDDVLNNVNVGDGNE